MPLPPAPKFQKRVHHVVPVFWQNEFAAPAEPGPWYKNVKSGKVLGAQGPGEKMAVNLANIVFDEYFRPSDKLEDQFGAIEGKASEGLRNLARNQSFDDGTRCDIAMLLAIQACRYPERYQSRLDLGKYLAIALGDHRRCADVESLNNELRKLGMTVEFTSAEFTRLTNASEQQLNSELEHILALHGYEADFNPELILAAALRVAEHLLALRWTLVVSDKPRFILSDHPVPATLGLKFAVGLTGSLGLLLDEPGSHSVENVDVRTATEDHIKSINSEVRQRAVEWICGPGSFVHGL